MKAVMVLVHVYARPNSTDRCVLIVRAGDSDPIAQTNASIAVLMASATMVSTAVGHVFASAISTACCATSASPTFSAPVAMRAAAVIWALATTQ